jgi:RNA polymerase sporulation-specific sigma factor
LIDWGRSDLYLNGLPETLTNDEINQLFQDYRGLGKLEARDKLIEANIKLVIYMVGRNIGFGNIPATYDQDDLTSIGIIGLIKAVETFKLDKNVKFATYASRCIHNEILMEFRRMKKTITDISLETKINIKQNSIDKEILLKDILPFDDLNFLIMETKEQYQSLLEEIKGIKPRDAELIKMRYGIEGSTKLTQKEIAQYFGMSQSYVSRIEKKIVKRLSKWLQERGQII